MKESMNSRRCPNGQATNGKGEEMNGRRGWYSGVFFWTMAFLAVVLIGLAPPAPAFAAVDCGLEPCPGTLPAIWPHPSKTAGDSVRILGWNLDPAGTYEIVIVQPDGLALASGTVTTDPEGDILGRYEGADGQPFVCAPPIPILEGTYQVRLYPYPWSRSLEDIPVAATSFYHN